MPIKVQIVFEDETGKPAVVQEVAQIERDQLSPATLGLTLEDAKTVLHGLQRHFVTKQVEDYHQLVWQTPAKKRSRFSLQLSATGKEKWQPAIRLAG